MKRLFVILALVPMLLLAQESGEIASSDGETGNIIIDKPTQAKYTDFFDIKNVSFNRKDQLTGKGELMQVEFQLTNNLDIDQEFYIFVVATNEEAVWRYNSFYSPTLYDEKNKGNENIFGSEVPVKKLYMKGKKINFIKADPSDLSNFEYEVDGKKEYFRYPKDKKSGVDASTGKPYLLQDSLGYRTALLSEYRKHYLYFNFVTILIFDTDEKLLYQQSWKIDGTRR